jgi:alkylation response protein AidB-like acyl-CoA dehydrogenase/acyl carrier protein
MMTVVHNSLGIWPILHHADAALRADLVPRLASGRELVAFAITEPAAGSNPQAIVSTATPDGDDAWRLNGTKCWSGTAGWASVINVFAQNVAADGTPSGVSGFVVPRSTRGLVMGPEALTLGMRGMVQNTIHLEGARVTRLQCLGLPGGGMQVARAAMQQGRLAIGAACIGGIKRCLQLLLRYAERRTISTGRLLDNPVLLDRVAALTSAVAGLDALVSLVAQRLDAGADVPEDLLIVCKIAGSEWFWRAADDLVQFLGGRGYVETNVAAQLLRDARVTRILEGPTEALEMFLGSRVVNDGEPLHRFLRADLAASDVSSRLAAAVSEIEERCTRGATEDPDARRWACALAGRIAVDAVLLAANAYAGDTNQAAQAGRRFDRAVALALDCAAQRERPSAVDAQSTIDRYTAAIGDVDQSLAGEDQAPDAMIRRTDRTASPRASAIVAAPPRGTEESVRRDAVPRGESALAAAGERSTVPTVVEPARSASVVSAAEIERFIVRRVAASLKMRESSIDPTRTLFDYGVDSVTTVMLVASLEDWLGVTCNPETVYDVPIIRRFAAHIASQQQPA